MSQILLSFPVEVNADGPSTSALTEGPPEASSSGATGEASTSTAPTGTIIYHWRIFHNNNNIPHECVVLPLVWSVCPPTPE